MAPSTPNYKPPSAILETVVYCPDLEAAKEFYEGVIGLQLFINEPNRHLFYKVGTGMLLVFNPETTSRVPVEVSGKPLLLHGARGASHFAFQVDLDQFDAIKARLSQHGVAIESEIAWPNGGHSIYCRDPAGNSVEFATRSLWFSPSEKS